jgi:RNA polymerase sigma-70 factor, ECF subfamily
VGTRTTCSQQRCRPCVTSSCIALASCESTRVQAHETLARFEQAVLPHLAAAYNLARWLTRDEHDAEDVVQDAYVRALTFFDSFHGGDSRAWLLTIVRHTCYTWLQRHRGHELATAFDDERHSGAREASNPETLLLQHANQQLLRQALETLPVELREVVVLRELEGLSYKEIAGVADLPLGTVMSRLSRARKRLQAWLADRLQREV